MCAFLQGLEAVICVRTLGVQKETRENAPERAGLRGVDTSTASFDTEEEEEPAVEKGVTDTASE